MSSVSVVISGIPRLTPAWGAPCRKRGPSAAPNARNVRGGTECQTGHVHSREWKWDAPLFVSGNTRAARQERRSSLRGMSMGHVFVPAALVLWVVVAVVRSFATPDPAPAPVP